MMLACNYSTRLPMAKIYLIGPSSGLERLNIDTYRAVEKVLKDMGHTVVVPHDLFHEEDNSRGGLTFEQVVKRRQDALVVCEMAVTIPGFSEDRYGNIEFLTAKQFRVKTIRFESFQRLKETV